MTTMTETRQPLVERLRESRIGQALAAGVRRTLDATIEGYLRIRTSGRAGTRGEGVLGDSNHYEPLDYPFLFVCLNALALREDDVVYDIGCGMGRVVCLLARRRVRKCVGVELSPELAQIAQENLRTLRGCRSAVEIIAADAVTVDYDDATAIYLFNSFGPVTMAAVLDRIGQSLARRPRPLRLLYVNPMHEDVLEATPWLRKTGIVRVRPFRMEASLWVHDPTDATKETSA